MEVVCYFNYRYVDDDLLVKEDFISLTILPNTSSDALYTAVKTDLEALKIPLSDCRGEKGTDNCMI